MDSQVTRAKNQGSAVCTNTWSKKEYLNLTDRHQHNTESLVFKLGLVFHSPILPECTSMQIEVGHRVIPGHQNWQIKETAVWNWAGFFPVL